VFIYLKEGNMAKQNYDGIIWDFNRQISDGALQLIGRTPLTKLNKISEEEGIKSTILGKLEFLNPTGSLKDRIYYEMIARGIESGELKPGMGIIEASTGNAGISCSFVGRILGYGVTIIIPKGMSKERLRLIEAYGGKLILTEGAESDVDLCFRRVEEMLEASPSKYWWPNQFANPNNPRAHYKTTANEIWGQTNGKIDCFVAAVGTGGTLTGIGRFLKEKAHEVPIYAVEPFEAPILSKRRWGSHKIEGIGDGFVPRNLDLSLLTGVVAVTSKESIDTAKRLALEEGLFCGISSGCNVAAAIKIAENHPEYKRIVTIINDTGQRYFSTELCGEEKVLDIPVRDHPLDSYTLKALEKHQGTWEMLE
jgi:cysteine synthase A